MRRWWVISALVALVFWVPAPAVADEPVTLVYEVTVEREAWMLDGWTDADPTITETVDFHCMVLECSAYLNYFPPDIVLTVDGDQASGSGEIPSTGDLCDPEMSWEPQTSWQVTIGATSLDASVESQPEEVECSGHGDLAGASAAGYRTLLTGVLVEGDTCVFEPGGCAPAEPTPVQTPTPTPTSTPEATPDPTPSETPAPPSAPSQGTVSRLGSGDPAAPSVMSGLVPPGQLTVEPPQLALAVLLTVVLVLLVAFPTSLLNSAVDTGTDRFSAWWKGRRHGGGVAAEAAAVAEAIEAETAAPTPKQPGRGWWWAAAGVGLAGLISAFVDPQFGFNPGSLRLLTSILIGFAVDVVLGWSLTVWLVKRVVPEATHRYEFKPVTLAVVILAVVLTRVTGFEPGIVFGLVAGVAFGALAGAAAEGRAALTSVGYAFGVALLAWTVYGLLGGGSDPGTDFWRTFLLETLGSVAIGGMAALPIALFPLRGLAGHTVWQWSRWIWAAAYAVGLLAFFVVLMPMPFSWEGVEWGLIGWVTVYVAYLATALGFWLAIARPWRTPTPPATTA